MRFFIFKGLNNYMSDFSTIYSWIQMNATWIDTNWTVLVSAASQIIAAASVLAALLPDKRTSVLIAALDKHINTDTIHKIIDFLAANVGNTVSKVKANALIDKTTTPVINDSTMSK